MNRRIDMQRISGQAGELAKAADHLNDLYAEKEDDGKETPPPAVIRDAEIHLNRAFIALIRVTSAYI